MHALESLFFEKKRLCQISLFYVSDSSKICYFGAKICEEIGFVKKNEKFMDKHW